MKESMKPRPKLLKDSFIPCDHAAQVHANVGGQLGVRHGLANGARHLAQILARWSDIYIHYALDLVMINFGRRLQEIHVDDIVQHRHRPRPVPGARFAYQAGGEYAPAGPPRMGRIRHGRTRHDSRWLGRPTFQASCLLHPAPKWNLHQIDGVVDRRRAVLVVLDSQEIVVAGLVVDPVIGSDHGVGIQRRNHVIDDLLLIQPELGGMDAIDVESHRGIVHVLGDVDFTYAGSWRIRSASICAVLYV